MSYTVLYDSCHFSYITRDKSVHVVTSRHHLYHLGQNWELTSADWSVWLGLPGNWSVVSTVTVFKPTIARYLSSMCLLSTEGRYWKDEVVEGSVYFSNPLSLLLADGGWGSERDSRPWRYTRGNNHLQWGWNGSGPVLGWVKDISYSILSEWQKGNFSGVDINALFVLLLCNEAIRTSH